MSKQILAEWETTNGAFVALGNKLYQCIDLDTDTTKKSTKGKEFEFIEYIFFVNECKCFVHEIIKFIIGIPHSNVFEMSLFEKILLRKYVDQHTVKVKSLRVNTDRSMCRMTTEKKALSDIFLKMSVQEDKITCTPLLLDGQLV